MRRCQGLRKSSPRPIALAWALQRQRVAGAARMAKLTAAARDPQAYYRAMICSLWEPLDPEEGLCQPHCMTLRRISLACDPHRALHILVLTDC